MGAIFGSFLNVSIYRLPKKVSVVRPGSMCPNCGHKIAWYENIPILSYIFLRGRCSSCRTKISIIYPLVEIVTGLICLTLFLAYGLTFKTLILFIMFSSLVVASFIDQQIHEIPDVITIPGIVLGLLISLIFPEISGNASVLKSVINSALGIVVGGGSLYIIGYVGEFIFKKEAMGGGDIKLLAMIGAFLGWKVAILTFFIAPFLGAIAGIIVKIKDKKDIIPYGPYLSLASLISLIWGEKIIRFIYGI